MPPTFRREGDRIRGFVRSYWTPAGRRAAANLGGLVACQAVGQGCVFGLLLVFTAALGPERYAAVATVQAVQAVLMVIAAAGLPAVLLRELAAHPERRRELVSGYVTATAGCSLLVGLLAAGVALVLPLSWDERTLWLLVAVGNGFAAVSPLPVFDADHRQAEAAARQLPADVLALIAALLLWKADALTLPTAGLVLLGRWAGQWLLTAGAFRRVRPAWAEANHLLRAGRPLAVAGVLALVPAGGGVLLLRARAGDEPAAVFGLANQLAAALPVLFGLFARVIAPHINGPHGRERSFVRKLTAATAGVLGGLLLAGAAVGWAAFTWVIDPRYAAAWPVLLMLLAGNAIYAAAIVVSLYLVRLGRMRAVTAGHAVAAGVVAVLYAVTRTPDPAGVAAGVIVGQVIYLLVCLLALRPPGPPHARTD